MTDLQITRRGRWAVSAMFLANGFVMGAWAPQIPLLLPRHQITEAVLGLLILVLGAGAVGAMLFSGRLIETFGADCLCPQPDAAGPGHGAVRGHAGDDGCGDERPCG